MRSDFFERGKGSCNIHAGQKKELFRSFWSKLHSVIIRPIGSFIHCLRDFLSYPLMKHSPAFCLWPTFRFPPLSKTFRSHYYLRHGVSSTAIIACYLIQEMKKSMYPLPISSHAFTVDYICRLI